MKAKLLVPVMALGLLSGCEYVNPGHVGIKVNMLGTKKGVEQEELGVGRYWIGMNERLYTFPTFTQNYVWTKTQDPKSPKDEALTFQSVEGLSVMADVGISYSLDPNKVGDIFQKYRKGVDEITGVYLRNMVRDSLVKLSSTMTIEEIYGRGKAKLIEDVTQSVSDSVKDIGIKIEKVYWIGKLTLPKTVVKSINAKIEATQKAQQRQNEVEQTIAEADKAREEAKGKADALLEAARATAEATKMKGDAQAYAIRVKGEAEAKSIRAKAKALGSNEYIIELTQAESWDGKLPSTMMGEGAMPILDARK